ncbi:protein asteroid homolog 1-like [Engraulis encrasicolus]|uniref:protein asteroid homolog 1-like n=1 Tax=Engraulis encrasicolus TaxID=184585 RepID=UPI002FD248C9
MGVQGLLSYIEENHHAFLKDCNFKRRELVIDGDNLCFNLYRGQHFDIKHGGDYYAFEIEIKKFFHALRSCNIEPYVVLDGGSDHTDKKLETLKRRARDRIKNGRDISLGRKHSGSVMPILLKGVFIEILSRLQVPFVQCMEEADWETAALANEWNCPVLSGDSDFFIFRLKAGFLPLSHFQWQKGASQKSIPAKKFLISNFCQHFNNMKVELVPVLAALAGNDYIKRERMCVSFNWEEYSRFNGVHGSRIDGILWWLSGFQSSKKAIKALLDSLQDPQTSGAVKAALAPCLREYQLSKSNIAQFFLNGLAPSKLPQELEIIPTWMRMPLSDGRMSAIVIEALVLQRVRVGPQVENFDLPSCNGISRPIRQVMYGLLLAGQKQRADRRPPVAHVTPGECYVEEYDREGVTLTSVWVKAACPVSGKNLHLETLNRAPKETRLQMLRDALGMTKPIPNSIAAKFHLAVYVTCYWLSRADPQPRMEHLWALLLGFVFGELSGRHKGKEGIALVWNRLNNLRTSCMVGRPDLEMAHTYSQWQACLYATYKLNRLLCLALPEPEKARLYCGPLVHQAALRLRRGMNPESLLSAGPVPLQLFRDLQDAVLDCLEPDVRDRLQKASRQNNPQDRRRTKSHSSVDDLASHFQHFEVDEEEEEEDDRGRGRRSKTDDEDDQLYGAACQIRTRHKKKRTGALDKLNKRDRVMWA